MILYIRKTFGSLTTTTLLRSTSSNSPSGTRSYSTSAPRSSEGLEITSSAGAMELSLPMTFNDIPHEKGGEGHKFGLPEVPLGRTDHFKKRYHPVVDQLTKSLMRHGKLGAAQKVELIITSMTMASILLIVMIGYCRYSQHPSYCSSASNQIIEDWTSVTSQRRSS